MPYSLCPLPPLPAHPLPYLPILLLLHKLLIPHHISILLLHLLHHPLLPPFPTPHHLYRLYPPEKPIAHSLHHLPTLHLYPLHTLNHLNVTFHLTASELLLQDDVFQLDACFAQAVLFLAEIVHEHGNGIAQHSGVFVHGAVG